MPISASYGSSTYIPFYHPTLSITNYLSPCTNFPEEKRTTVDGGKKGKESGVSEYSYFYLSLSLTCAPELLLFYFIFLSLFSSFFFLLLFPFSFWELTNSFVARLKFNPANSGGPVTRPDFFTVSKPRNPSIQEFYVLQNRRSDSLEEFGRAVSQSVGHTGQLGLD